MNVSVLAEFDTPEALLAAVRALRGRGFRQLDTYTPYPLHGLEEALGLGRSFLNWLVFPIGLTGAAFGFLLQGLLNAHLYPLNVGGRATWATPAFIIISFETMILFSAAGGFVLLFWLCRLPRLRHPVFSVDGFESATGDRFWLGVDAADPRFDPGTIERELLGLQARRVEFVGGTE